MGLLCLLAVGLIAAAFVAPPVAQFQAPDPSGSASSACVIETDDDPIPGTQLSILVTSPSGPVADVPVFLSNERVGATNESGVVEATVPYDSMFEVTADVSEQSACDVTRDGGVDADGNGVGSADGDVEPDPNRTVEIVSANETGTPPSAETKLTSGLTIPLQSIDGVGTEDDTATETETETAPTIDTLVSTHGDLTIDAPTTAQPGEEVDIRAEISTHPVPDASVRVGGNPAGETDENGTATVALPEDSQNATITVSRGDFGAQTVVDIQLLELSFADTGLVVPGQSATVEALEGAEPASDAPITVDGETVATTDDDGHATVDLPWDPTASVTVETATQSASVSVWTHYAGHIGIAAVLLVLLTVLTAVAAWLDGRRGVVLLYAGLTALGGAVLAARLQTPLFTAVLAFILLAATTAIAGRLGGWRGIAALYATLFVATGTILASRIGGTPAAIGVGIAGLIFLAICWLWFSSHGSDADGDSDGDDQPLTDRLRERLTTAVLKTVSQLETVLALTPRFGHWLRTQPRSARRLAGRFGGWLAGAPSAVRTSFNRLGRRRLGVIVTFVLAVSVGVALAGLAGGLIAVGIFLALGILSLGIRWYRDRPASATDSAASGDHAPTAATEREASGSEAHQPESVPDLWRAFARGVTPTWETRAPAEIEARAIDQGYPDGPVNGLTTVFCEIEYGGRSPTDTMVERAKAAYAKLDLELELELESESEPTRKSDAGGER